MFGPIPIEAVDLQDGGEFRASGVVGDTDGDWDRFVHFLGAGFGMVEGYEPFMERWRQVLCPGVEGDFVARPGKALSGGDRARLTCCAVHARRAQE